MKKVLIAAIALVMGASLSLAGMGIQWGDGGWMAELGGDVNAGPGVAENNDVLWQLIFAGANNLADAPDFTAVNYLGGDDEMITSREIAQGGGVAADGTEWDSWLQQANTESTVYEDLTWSDAGKVYQRIWQITPEAGTPNAYFETALFDIDTGYAGGGAAPQVFNYDATGNGIVVDHAVPEPATMSLLGLGALAMVLRRKLRK